MELSCDYDDGYFDKDEQGWVIEFTSLALPWSDGAVPELLVRAVGASSGASVTVNERAQCTISGRGDLELHPQARTRAGHWSWP